MRVIFEHGGLSIEQDASTGALRAVITLGFGGYITQELSVEKAMEMTAKVNSAAFPYSQSSRVNDLQPA